MWIYSKLSSLPAFKICKEAKSPIVNSLEEYDTRGWDAFPGGRGERHRIRLGDVSLQRKLKPQFELFKRTFFCVLFGKCL